MEIKKADLQKILEDLRPGLAKRDIVNTLSDFTFFGDRIGTFNDQISISYPFEFGPSCSVDGQSFYQVVMNSVEGDIALRLKEEKEVSEGEKPKLFLIIKSGGGKEGSKASLKTSEAVAVNKIKVPSMKSKLWRTIPERFIEGVKFCSFSVSTDLTRPYLTCVAVKKDKIYSSDGLRISQYSLDGEFDEDDFLILGESAAILAKYKTIEKYVKDDNWIHFRTEENIIFSCRVIKETFPDVSKHFVIKHGVSFVLPKGVKEVVDSVSTVADAEFSVDRVVKVSISGNSIECSGRGSQGSFDKWFTLEKKVEGNIQFGINPLFFSEILSESDLKMKLDENHALFETEIFQHVMCLPRK